jgi:hypothetical protein|tara:strand:+ start:54 stop:263 length:210 start_codon:yes stop_codon:yes gene_type:complete
MVYYTSSVPNLHALFVGVFFCFLFKSLSLATSLSLSPVARILGSAVVDPAIVAATGSTAAVLSVVIVRH